MNLTSHHSNKIFGLDLFRAIAIFFVIISHLYFVLDINNPTFIGISGVLGFVGVEMFFVLSGFLIGNIILKNFSKTNYSLKTVLNFWKRRWLRTLPAYYFVLIINYIVAIYFEFTHFNFYYYFLFLQNFSLNKITFFTESWSLSVEEWTYLLLPLFVFVITKYVVKTLKIGYLTIIVLVIFLIHLLRFSNNNNVFYEGMDLWNENLKSIVIYRLDAIAYGFLVSWFYQYCKDFLFKYAVYLFVISGHLFVIQFFVLNVLGVTLLNNPIYFNVFYFTLTSVTMMFAIPIFIFWEKSMLFGRIISFISKISYSLYLLHYSVCAVLFKYFLKYFEMKIDWSLKLLIYVFFTSISAILLYNFIEKPFLKIRDKLTIS